MELSDFFKLLDELLLNFKAWIVFFLIIFIILGYKKYKFNKLIIDLGVHKKIVSTTKVTDPSKKPGKNDFVIEFKDGIESYTDTTKEVSYNPY